MLRYILNRLFNAIPLVLIITFISFFIIQLAPGDYFDKLKLIPEVSPEMIQQQREHYGLDQNKFIQYTKWLWGLVRFDFGYSFEYHDKVINVIRMAVVNTFVLSFVTMVITWITAIPLGIYASRRQHSFPDRVLSLFAFAGMSLPSFFLALLLMVASYKLGFLPKGTVPAMKELFSGFNPGGWKIYLHHLALPVLILWIGSIAGYMRLMRANMLEELRQQYVTTAKAKGLSERIVVYRHALRNAINPMITIFGYRLSALLSGAAFVEIITGWPGLGRIMLQAVLSQDIYLVMASTVIGTWMLIAGNLIADILMVVTDPRIRVR